MPEIPSSIAAYLPLVVINALPALGRSRTGYHVVNLPHCAVLFLDIVGFTPLCESLAGPGTGPGAELLSSGLRAYFTVLQDVTLRWGGDVVKYAGDALVAVWQGGNAEGGQAAARRALQCALDVQSQLDGFPFVKGAKFRIRIGVGCGQASLYVMCRAKGTDTGKPAPQQVPPRIDYVLIGPALAQAIRAEKYCGPGSVVASREVMHLVHCAFSAQAMGAGHSGMVITGCISPLDPPVGTAEPCVLPTDVLALANACVPAGILPHLSPTLEPFADELRTVSVVFVHIALNVDWLHGGEDAMHSQRIVKGDRIQGIVRPSVMHVGGAALLTTTTTSHGVRGQEARAGKGTTSCSSRTSGTTRTQTNEGMGSPIAASLEPSFDPAVSRGSEAVHIREQGLAIQGELGVNGMAAGTGTAAVEETDVRGGVLQSILFTVRTVADELEGELTKAVVDDKGLLLLAVWGIPPSGHENDPERATLAALGIASRIQELRASIEAKHGSEACNRMFMPGPPCSVGVCSGVAFCGSIGGTSRREYTIIGDLVNTAARLMIAAKEVSPLGQAEQLVGGVEEVLVDVATRDGARYNPALQLLAVPSLMLKGKTKPVQAYRPSYRLSEVPCQDRCAPCQDCCVNGEVVSLYNPPIMLHFEADVAAMQRTQLETEPSLAVPTQQEFEYERSDVEFEVWCWLYGLTRVCEDKCGNVRSGSDGLSSLPLRSESSFTLPISCIILTGEPGIGKSSTVASLVARACSELHAACAFPLACMAQDGRVRFGIAGPTTRARRISMFDARWGDPRVMSTVLPAPFNATLPLEEGREEGDCTRRSADTVRGLVGDGIEENKMVSPLAKTGASFDVLYASGLSCLASWTPGRTRMGGNSVCGAWMPIIEQAAELATAGAEIDSCEGHCECATHSLQTLARNAIHTLRTCKLFRENAQASTSTLGKHSCTGMDENDGGVADERTYVVAATCLLSLLSLTGRPALIVLDKMAHAGEADWKLASAVTDALQVAHASSDRPRVHLLCITRPLHDHVVTGEGTGAAAGPPRGYLHLFGCLGVRLLAMSRPQESHTARVIAREARVPWHPIRVQSSGAEGDVGVDGADMPSLPPSLLSLVHTLSNGHPLYASCLVQALMQVGMVTTPVFPLSLQLLDGSTRKVRTRVLQSSVKATVFIPLPYRVQRLVSSRLDSLSPHAVLLLKTAAVLCFGAGQAVTPFCLQFVRSLYPASLPGQDDMRSPYPPSSPFAAQVDELLAAGLLRYTVRCPGVTPGGEAVRPLFPDRFVESGRVSSSSPSDVSCYCYGGLAFDCGLTRDAVYHQMLYTQRRRLHRAAAHFLIGQWRSPAHSFAPVQVLPNSFESIVADLITCGGANFAVCMPRRDALKSIYRHLALAGEQEAADMLFDSAALRLKARARRSTEPCRMASGSGSELSKTPFSAETVAATEAAHSHAHGHVPLPGEQTAQGLRLPVAERAAEDDSAVKEGAAEDEGRGPSLGTPAATPLTRLAQLPITSYRLIVRGVRGAATISVISARAIGTLSLNSARALGRALPALHTEGPWAWTLMRRQSEARSRADTIGGTPEDGKDRERVIDGAGRRLTHADRDTIFQRSSFGVSAQRSSAQPTALLLTVGEGNVPTVRVQRQGMAEGRRRAFSCVPVLSALLCSGSALETSACSPGRTDPRTSHTDASPVPELVTDFPQPDGGVGTVVSVMSTEGGSSPLSSRASRRAARADPRPGLIRSLMRRMSASVPPCEGHGREEGEGDGSPWLPAPLMALPGALQGSESSQHATVTGGSNQHARDLEDILRGQPIVFTHNWAAGSVNEEGTRVLTPDIERLPPAAFATAARLGQRESLACSSSPTTLPHVGDGEGEENDKESVRHMRLCGPVRVSPNRLCGPSDEHCCEPIQPRELVDGAVLPARVHSTPALPHATRLLLWHARAPNAAHPASLPPPWDAHAKEVQSWDGFDVFMLERDTAKGGWPRALFRYDPALPLSPSSLSSFSSSSPSAVYPHPYPAAGPLEAVAALIVRDLGIPREAPAIPTLLTPTAARAFISAYRTYALGVLFVQACGALGVGYVQSNPYHNSLHAADVAQATYALLCTGQRGRCTASGVALPTLTRRQVLTAVLAAAMHDFRHPGLTAPFLSAMGHPIVTRSVPAGQGPILEWYHAAEALEAVQDLRMDVPRVAPPSPLLYAPVPLEWKECTLTELLVEGGGSSNAPASHCPPSIEPDALTDASRVRKEVTTMVLATSLAEHGAWLADLGKEGEAGARAPRRWTLLQMAVKAADLGNPGKRSTHARDWAVRIMAEFHAQGDAERGAGLPPSRFMDRTKSHTDVPECQVGFTTFIALPLFRVMAGIWPGTRHVALRRAEANNRTWKAVLAHAKKGGE